MIFRDNKCPLTAAIVFLAATLLAQRTQKPTDPEHPCEDAKNQKELNQCAGEQYRKADARLNVVYGKALTFMQKDLSEAQEQRDADQVKYNQAAIEKLKTAERAWIRYRDLHCDAARHQNGGGSVDPMIWAFCMEQTTTDRVEELKQAYETGERKLE
jgi:uncharacterized protein YecT (DUF1311 family)